MQVGLWEREKERKNQVARLGVLRVWGCAASTNWPWPRPATQREHTPKRFTQAVRRQRGTKREVGGWVVWGGGGLLNTTTEAPLSFSLSFYLSSTFIPSFFLYCMPLPFFTDEQNRKGGKRRRRRRRKRKNVMIITKWRRWAP